MRGSLDRVRFGVGRQSFASWMVRSGRSLVRRSPADSLPGSLPLGLDALAADPSIAGSLSPDTVRALWLRCHVVLGALAPVMATATAATPSLDESDQLLSVKEAAHQLGVSVDWLYRHAATLPFTVRPTPGTLRFSCQGIAHYLKRRTGSQGGSA
jgi:predicted DNA-binding transcriptional regulator AlpA